MECQICQIVPVHFWAELPKWKWFVNAGVVFGCAGQFSADRSKVHCPHVTSECKHYLVSAHFLTHCVLISGNAPLWDLTRRWSRHVLLRHNQKNCNRKWPKWNTFSSIVDKSSDWGWRALVCCELGLCAMLVTTLNKHPWPWLQETLGSLQRCWPVCWAFLTLHNPVWRDVISRNASLASWKCQRKAIYVWTLPHGLCT